MTDQWQVIIGLAMATFAIRISGYLLAAKLPKTGAWAQAFAALPGCLIAALLTVVIVQGTITEWLAAAFALTLALITRSLPLTMIGGIVAIWILRTYTGL